MQIKFYKQQLFILNLAFISSFLVSIIGLFQAFGFSPFGIHYYGPAAATFINPNHASIYIEFFIPVLLILILIRKNNNLKVFYSISLGVSLSFLYILSSFGTLISLFLALIITGTILSKYLNIYSSLKKNKTNLAIIFISVITITSFYTLLPSSNSLTLKKQTKPISLITQKSSHKIRLGLYSKSIEAIIDNPISGFGYGGFRAGILPYLSEVQTITNHNEYLYFLETHNDFIQQYTETGIIGGTLFISFFFIVLFLGLSSLKKTHFSDRNIFIFAISSGLLTLILHSFIDFPFHLSASNFLIYLVAGFILSHTAKHVFFKKNIYFKVAITAMLFIFSLLLLVSINYNISHIKSNKLIRDTAIALHKEKNCNKAIRLIDESNEIFKFDFQSQASQAQIYGICPQNITKQNKVIQQLVDLNPTNFRARILKGNLALISNDSTSAFKNYFYVVHMLPNSALGYIGLGKWAIKTNKLKDAHYYFEKANELEPNSSEVNFYLKQLNKHVS